MLTGEFSISVVYNRKLNSFYCERKKKRVKRMIKGYGNIRMAYFVRMNSLRRYSAFLNCQENVFLGGDFKHIANILETTNFDVWKIERNNKGRRDQTFVALLSNREGEI